MAFTTELVAAAQTGPGAERITGGSITSGSTSWSRTWTLPTGQWLVIVRCRTDITGVSGSSRKITIDGVTALQWRPGDGNADLYQPTAIAEVVGGRTITIAGDSGFSGSRGWDWYAFRIPT